MKVRKFNDRDWMDRRAIGIEVSKSSFRFRMGLMLGFNRPQTFERYHDDGYFHLRAGPFAVTYRAES